MDKNIVSLFFDSQCTSVFGSPLILLFTVDLFRTKINVIVFKFHITFFHENFVIVIFFCNCNQHNTKHSDNKIKLTFTSSQTAAKYKRNNFTVTCISLSK